MTAPVLASWDGWWWPASDERARPVLTREVGPAVEWLLSHVPGRELIVQAGGNVGLFPLALADHFATVVTAEPDPANFHCLIKNLSERPTQAGFEAHCVAFSDGHGWGDIVEAEPGNCGAHRMAYRPAMQPGPVRVLPIDALHLSACDAIWLDCEGSELFALIGAADTIERFSPTICIEDKGHHRSFGIPDGELQRWLSAHGYSEVARLGNDKVYRRYA
jgi:FkbM family methyltransferase